ncbi:MAG: MFS transporter [Anaerolineales bacterium]|nr:MFS transporter [Anaerolineales bacterium]
MKTNPATALYSAVVDYATKVKSFQPNARLYLMNVVVTGATMGVFRLLFNFYVLSLGFNEALLGSLITATSLTSLIAALPSGYLADLLGRKNSLLISASLISLSILGMVLWPTEAVFYIMSILSGVAQSLWAITMAPFLMENSGEKERTYLFALSSGLNMAMASAGSWIGGYLPTWMAGVRMVTATSSDAYGGALLITAMAAALGLIPLAMMRTPRLEKTERSVFAPLAYAVKHPALLSRLILPMLLTSIGAGLIMPFMNVFYRVVHHQPDTVIGALFAWGALAMGIGLLLAPPLADRMGKIQLVVITQALSIPFLIILGFTQIFWLSAAAYYIRLALMNMSSPVYNTFVMERVDPSARATVASLVSMSWNFGWAFSPTVSGYMQVHYGFGPPFIGTIIFYMVSIYMYWAFFWKGKAPQEAEVIAES